MPDSVQLLSELRWDYPVDQVPGSGLVSLAPDSESGVFVQTAYAVMARCHKVRRYNG